MPIEVRWDSERMTVLSVFDRLSLASESFGNHVNPKVRKLPSSTSVIARAFLFWIQVPQGRQPENYPRKFPGELIIADIELEEELQSIELVGDLAVESIRVDMKQREIGEETELLKEITGDVGMVDVNSGISGEITELLGERHWWG
ncbi:uncharacterized protein A4U43_C07F14480 [Asparagus officinalis]|uniref:Uncharacterized protein n=1 Tax=Asparagus officinalis TaxID=4686 RepID=A0A5P1EBW9_ASPOF|nr:uncharacterized protein A4U43_C07F14480 [Asparagus officinalis]